MVAPIAVNAPESRSYCAWSWYTPTTAPPEPAKVAGASSSSDNVTNASCRSGSGPNARRSSHVATDEFAEPTLVMPAQRSLALHRNRSELTHHITNDAIPIVEPMTKRP